MAQQAPLKYVFYIAATAEKVWEGFVSRESNLIIFSGAEFQADLKPGGLLAWVGAGPDGKPMTYVRGKVLRFEPPKILQYTFATSGGRGLAFLVFVSRQTAVKNVRAAISCASSLTISCAKRRTFSRTS